MAEDKTVSATSISVETLNGTVQRVQKSPGIAAGPQYAIEFGMYGAFSNSIPFCMEEST